MLGITNSSNAPSVVLKDTVVSTWYSLPSTGTDSDMKTQGYTYYSSISATGVTANTIAEVTFSDAQAKSGNYAPICRTYADEIRVYSKVNTSITIPSIIIHSIVENYYEMDNSPVSGSTNPITSGGVYDVINTVTTTTSGTATIQKYGKLVIIVVYAMAVSSTGQWQSTGVSVPKPISNANGLLSNGTGTYVGQLYVDANSNDMRYNAVATGTSYGTIIYFTND